MARVAKWVAVSLFMLGALNVLLAIASRNPGVIRDFGVPYGYAAVGMWCWAFSAISAAAWLISILLGPGRRNALIATIAALSLTLLLFWFAYIR